VTSFPGACWGDESRAPCRDGRSFDGRGRLAARRPPPGTGSSSPGSTTLENGNVTTMHLNVQYANRVEVDANNTW